MADALTDYCRATLGDHLARHPADAGRLADFVALAADPPGPLHDRRTVPGHVTASGVVVHRGSRRVLLIHHNVIGRWLPPGGHLEAGELPLAAARREVLEEVGLALGEPLGGGPVYVDSHPILANAAKGEPAHTHHDFRFAFDGDPAAPLSADAAEVSAAAWVAYDDPRVPANLRPALAAVDALPDERR